ncbi:MAG: hypothetical protein KA974_02605 [Saprospiraceae bacterium]|nr:hypothetical protein [Saprospiraceae bacterium]MBP7680069.1 hypothetical protein [Saprospiraceae bacterium]
MEHNFTNKSSQFIQYLYHETTPTESLSVIQEVANNPIAKQTFRQLAEAKQALPNVQLAPSGKSIANILEYSRQSALEKA